MRFLLILAVLLTACGSTAASESPSASPSAPEASAVESLTITGIFTLVNAGNVERDVDFGNESMTHCTGTGGFDDITTGTQVIVRNGADEIIGTGRLGHDMPYPTKLLQSQNVCTFTFAVEAPASDFYSVEVGDRGKVTYSRDELDAMDWKLSLTLGG